jgi:hypothetical protein
VRIERSIFGVGTNVEDFGTWRPNILIGLSLVAWGVGFGWLGVHDASKLEIAGRIYIVGRETSSPFSW